jgi:hypothetical protein
MLAAMRGDRFIASLYRQLRRSSVAFRRFEAFKDGLVLHHYTTESTIIEQAHLDGIKCHVREHWQAGEKRATIALSAIQ